MAAAVPPPRKPVVFADMVNAPIGETLGAKLGACAFPAAGGFFCLALLATAARLPDAAVFALLVASGLLPVAGLLLLLVSPLSDDPRERGSRA